MIPQIAHHPRNLSQKFGNPAFAAPPPFEPSQQLPPPLPFRHQRRSLGSPPQIPLLGAFPVESHVPHRTGFPVTGSSTGYGGQHHDPSEHMLRRKTPNGTLAAGYDGTPVQWSSKPPALKHVLLPLSSSQQGPTHSAYQHDPILKQRATTLEWAHHQAPDYQANDLSSGIRMNSDPGKWAYPPPLANPPRNILDQFSMQQAAPYYPNNGMQIPTVLQPLYQPSPGPTASNDAGVYGPYWPDGNFQPYRPAAFRESEHHESSQNPGSNRGYQTQSVGIPQRTFRQPSFNVDSAQIIARPSYYSMDNSPRLHETRYVPPQHSHHHSYDSKAIFSPLTDGSRTLTAQPSSRANNTHFKEKSLAWAHSIYVDLLAYIHQSKKEQKQARQGHGRSYSKNNIYPKPPRQPASAFGKAEWTQIYTSSSSAPVPEDDAISPRTHIGNLLSGPQRTTPTGSLTGWQQSNKEFADQKHWRTSSQEMPHYVAPFRLSHAVPSAVARANEAVEMLTNLCEQSHWSWIDGMLLGGCLAYGLEKYDIALDWYTKIIAIDPKHVEAMSNLAATLLCLNRRAEAEQYWMQAIKHRPSYFEAVEHLIGLLCSEHRGSEAVAIIDRVEKDLRLPCLEGGQEYLDDNADRDSIASLSASSDKTALDYDLEDNSFRSPAAQVSQYSPDGFGCSGYAIPGCDNGRILALVHAKGNMLYALGDVDSASRAFEDAVLISAGRSFGGIQGLITKIISALSHDGFTAMRSSPPSVMTPSGPLLLPPDKACETASLVFTKNGDLPGLHYVPEGLAKKAAISTTSNSLLSLAKIFQDAMSNSSSPHRISRLPTGVGDILALYYLSLSLQQSPSTANNVGILLASVPQPASYRPTRDSAPLPHIPGVAPGSGVALALAYYNYGLLLDAKHAHLYTNLGSLLKDIGQLNAAIKMYEKAVDCDSTFDIALANLANAVKDQSRTSDAIQYYRRAVASSPDFAEAVCGLANALNSVCDWAGRGGVVLDSGKQDRWHVDDAGMLTTASGQGSGWMKRVVDIVARQLKDGSSWGRGTLQGQHLLDFLNQLEIADTGSKWPREKRKIMESTVSRWAHSPWEGARILRLIERAIKRAMHRWYHDKYINKRELHSSSYPRPQVPSSLTVPTAPTVLPFHTFTCPLPAKDIRMISQRNALRISCSTLRSPWMQGHVFRPPPPPTPYLNIGYVSSDFNNHPLAHLMQSVFGLHNPSRAKAFCYATTASDSSDHRKQIEREAPVFRDVSAWSPDKLVNKIVEDEIHILINLNGYTRGARNEIFAARPAPIQMSFMGFAGTLGAEWCDYILADTTAIPPDTLRPMRQNIELGDQLQDQDAMEGEDWVYSENVIFCRDTFFCCDHAQSESREKQPSWEDEQAKRWKMRKELFPNLPDDAIILGNFNQLYKIEPTIFRTWLRILDQVPKAILWLLRFPDLGETNLKRTAAEWAGGDVADRIWFTDVAPKHQHISRARVCDLFLDTPECNAHTTAADVLWSSTPLLTLPRYKYKMCSRMAASILKGALPRGKEGEAAAAELIAKDDDEYEKFAIRLASGLSYQRSQCTGGFEAVGRLAELRKLLYESRWTCALFDTRRWVSDLEEAYAEAWRRWVANEGGDIYL